MKRRGLRGYRDPIERFRVGDRVGFSHPFLRGADIPETDPLWRMFGVVVGLQPPRMVRVKFDGEETPRSIPAVNLVKP